MEERDMKGRNKPDVVHIIMRSLDGCLIFRDRRDLIKFLSLLEHFRKRTDSLVYAFAPMSFHVHIEAGSKDPMALATLLSCSYTGYYNTRYHNGSAVFEHPPLIYPKKTLEWQVDNLLYVMNNPVVAGLCKGAGGYRYGSYDFYTDRKTNLSKVIEVDTSLMHENFDSLSDFRKALAGKLAYERQMESFKYGSGHQSYVDSSFRSSAPWDVDPIQVAKSMKSAEDERMRRFEKGLDSDKIGQCPPECRRTGLRPGQMWQDYLDSLV